MADLYIKRNSLVSADPFDPARTDQGVTVNLDDDGNVLSYTVTVFGRVQTVRPGDILLTDSHATWPVSGANWPGIYQRLSDVVTPDDSAIQQTGGNQ